MGESHNCHFQQSDPWRNSVDSTLTGPFRGLKGFANGRISIARAAQQERRQRLKGTKKDFQKALNYLKIYRQHMDFAERKKRVDPIGSGIKEAGCKVIFNQRLKQSGMRWHRQTGQYIVDLQTAQRSGIWLRIWYRLILSKTYLPPIAHAMDQNYPQTR